MVRRFFIAALAACLVLMLPGPGRAQTTEETGRFPAPMVRGFAVNWCKHQGRDCGQPAADLFCAEMGFDRASAFVHDQRSGARGIDSVIFGDGMLCQGVTCQSFAEITCTRTVAAPAPAPQPTGPAVPRTDDVIVAQPPAPPPAPPPALPPAAPPPITAPEVSIFPQARPQRETTDLTVADDPAPWGGAQPLAIGAELAICLHHNCELTNDANGEATIGQMDRVFFDLDLTAIDFATLGLWQVADRAFPQFTGAAGDMEPPGLLAQGLTPGGAAQFPIDLDAALPDGSQTRLPALYVRVVPLRGLVTDRIEAAPTNTVRVALGAAPDRPSHAHLWAGARLGHCLTHTCEFATNNTLYLPAGSGPADFVSDSTDNPMFERLVWQLSDRPFAPVTGTAGDFSFDGLLASGEVAGGRTPFQVDVAGAVGPGRVERLGRLYVRTIPVYPQRYGPDLQAFGRASNSIAVAYGRAAPPPDPDQITIFPELFETEHPPWGLFTAEIVTFEQPWLETERLEGCVEVREHVFDDTTSEMVREAMDILYPVGSRHCPERYRGDDGKVETLGEFIDWALDSYDWVIDQYNGLVALAVDIVFELTPLGEQCALLVEVTGVEDGEGVCRAAASAAVQTGMSALGVPPSLPSFNQLVDEGVDYAVDLAAQEITSRTGVPCGPGCTDGLRAGMGALADRLKRQSDQPACIDETEAHARGFEPMCLPTYLVVRPVPGAVTSLPFVQVRVTRTAAQVPEFQLQTVTSCGLSVALTTTNTVGGYEASSGYPGGTRIDVPRQMVSAALYGVETAPVATDMAPGESVLINLTPEPVLFVQPWTAQIWSAYQTVGPAYRPYGSDWQEMFWGGTLRLDVAVTDLFGSCLATEAGPSRQVQLPEWGQ